MIMIRQVGIPPSRRIRDLHFQRMWLSLFPAGVDGRADQWNL